jgi:hypothetical protein
VYLLHGNQGITLMGQLNNKGPTHTILLTGFPSNRAPLPFGHALTTLFTGVPDRQAALRLNLARDTDHAYHSDIYACCYMSIRKTTGDPCVSKTTSRLLHESTTKGNTMTRAGLHPGPINLNSTFSQPKAVFHLACALPLEKEKGVSILGQCSRIRYLD